MNHYWTTWVLTLCMVALKCKYIIGQTSDDIDTSPTADVCPSSPYPQCQLSNGLYGSCKPLSMCAYYYGTKSRFQNCTEPYQTCKFGCNNTGVCCPNVVYTGKRPEPVNETVGKFQWTNPSIDDSVVYDCIKQATIEMKYFQQDAAWERDASDESYFNTGMHPSEYMSKNDLFSCGYLIMRVGDCLQNRTNGLYNPLAVDQAIRLSDEKYVGKLPPDCAVCSTFHKECSEKEKKLRTYDGICNNLENPYFGKADMPIERFFPPNYADNSWSPTSTYENSNVRELRRCLLPEKQMLDCGISQMTPDLGQLMVHDVAGGAHYQGSTSGGFLDCCYEADQQGMPKCSPINVKGDPFYTRANKTCMNLPRIATGVRVGCPAAHAAQINAVSHYLDCSFLYGSSEETANKIRAHSNGLLKTEGYGCDQTLPTADEYMPCNKKAQGSCRLCGDNRCNEQPGLVTLTTLFARFHNYCANQIRCVNPHYDDEKIYQECRRIVIAMYQHIIYYEYVPLLVGYDIATYYGVMGPSCDYSRDYVPEETASTRAEWAASTCRFHTSVNGHIKMRDGCYQVKKVDQLANYYFNPRNLVGKGNMDMFLRGRFAECQSRIDKLYDCQITSCALRNTTKYGHDMASINIERTYDYGIRKYSSFRDLCQLGKVDDWNDLYEIMHPSDVECLQGIYKDIENLPLYVAGLMEKHTCDAMTGPTFAHVNAQMFKYWRDADRFYYTSPDAGFTPEQLEEIRKATLALFICESSCVKCAPTFALLVPGPKNKMICCADDEKIPKIDWTKWQEAQPSRTGSYTDL